MISILFSYYITIYHILNNLHIGCFKCTAGNCQWNGFITLTKDRYRVDIVSLVNLPLDDAEAGLPNRDQVLRNVVQHCLRFCRLTSFSACGKSFLCFETNITFTAVPHYCAEYFWLSAAKVWTQPFIILSQGKQLASFSKQTPWDADWSMLSCGLLAESHYFLSSSSFSLTHT